MAWMVGIDEAGYGPNLGPFVMSMAVLAVRDENVDADLWQVLSPFVRRACDDDDSRLIVDDSKAVHSPTQGLAGLERNLCPFLWEQRWTAALRQDVLPLSIYWPNGCLSPYDRLLAEPWHQCEGSMPHNAELLGVIRDGRAMVRQAGEAAGVKVHRLCSVAVFPRQFNALVREHDSKAAVTAYGLRGLLAELPPLLEKEARGRVVVDKLGGRNFYHPLLQAAFPDQFVVIREESAARSSYRIGMKPESWEIAFEPKADQSHLAVALASMLSKYLRELLMLQFNAFWQVHCPGVTPTAGYPNDAKRFYDDIADARRKLQIADDVLWRVR